jgi:hypothetical protein
MRRRGAPGLVGLISFVVACATPPEGRGPAVPSEGTPPARPSASGPASTTTPGAPVAAASEKPEAGVADGCAEESETVPIVISTQHTRGKKGGFTVKMSAPPLKVDETLIDTATINGTYNCCAMTEMESVRFECEISDNNQLGRVYRDKDELVIDRGEGHEPKRVPIPCGAWVRFRGPQRECASSS